MNRREPLRTLAAGGAAGLVTAGAVVATGPAVAVHDPLLAMTEEERHYFLLRAEQESGRLMMDMAFEVHAHCAAQLAAGSEDPAEGPEA